MLPVIGLVQARAEGDDAKPQTIYAFSVEDIGGNEVSLEEYAGDVVMIVNVASRCGFTSQYEGLQELYERYRDRGFYVLGFPANDFLNQEPGSNEEIKTFCTTEFNVTFPMFSKISVKGAEQHPLYAFLTNEDTNPDYAGRITWNFNKFLVGRDGKVVARFGSRTKPLSDDIIEAVEAALQ
jgi:glutathione peroxidase